MKLKKHLSNLLKVFICVAFIASAIEIHAQNGTTMTVSGTIVDAAGIPVIGAVVIDPANTSNGCISNVDGDFTMQAAVGKVLKVSSIGYREYQFTVLAQPQKYKIVLQEDNVELEEVVVVGYGVQKKVTMTGAVSAIQNKEIVTTKNENLQNMLTGKIPGLRIVQNTSEPGQFTNKMDIRGFGTPLVIIDGVPRDNMAKIDAEDIESISVLKDASAAVYGVRAANGVILITTKKGTKGHANVSYSGNMTWQVPTNFPDLVEAADIMTLVNEKVIHNVDESANRTYSLEEIADYRNGVKRGTNWKNELFRNSAPQTQHSINISGGGDKVTYFASAGYQYQESYLRSNAINYEKFNLRSNISANVTNNLKFDLNISGMMDERESSPANSGAIIYEGWLSSPLEPVWYDEEKGMYASRFNPAGYNPAALMDTDLTGHCTYQSKWFQSNASLTWDIPWVKGLSVSGMYSYDYIANNDDEYRKAYNLYDTSGNAIVKGAQTAAPNKISRYFYSKQNNLWQARLSYDNNFGKHNVGALILIENQHKVGDNFYGSRQVALDMDKVFAGITTNQEFNQNADQSVLYDNANRALVGRLNYDYAGKYIAEFAFRHEASSLFPKETRWGFFPSVSAGWRMSREKFMERTQNWLSDLKLRASWGINGNDQIDNNATYNLYYTNMSNGSYNFNGDGATVVPGVQKDRSGNNDLKWEETKQLNFGIDAAFFDNRLGLTLDYFQKKTTGMLIQKPYIGVIGEGGYKWYNAASMDNSGVEATFTWRDEIKDFKYDISFNISYYKNEITELPDVIKYTWGGGNGVDKTIVGQPYGSWMSYKADGVFKTKQEVYEYLSKYDVQIGAPGVGRIRYKDLNGDNVINTADMDWQGSDQPKFIGGLNIGASYKGFDLSAFFNGMIRDAWNNSKFYTDLFQGWTGNHSVRLMDAMHAWNDYEQTGVYNCDIPALTVVDNNVETRSSTFFIEDGSYVKLKTLTLGYTFPDKWIKKARLSNLRVYLQAQNVFTLTNYTGADPEGLGYPYPQPRTYTFGLSLGF